jgi:hypothetical protein
MRCADECLFRSLRRISNFVEWTGRRWMNDRLFNARDRTAKADITLCLRKRRIGRVEPRSEVVDALSDAQVK